MHRYRNVFLISHGRGDRLLVSATDTALLDDGADADGASSSVTSPVTWERCPEEDQQNGFRICLHHTKVHNSIVEHDYLHVLT